MSLTAADCHVANKRGDGHCLGLSLESNFGHLSWQLGFDGQVVGFEAMALQSCGTAGTRECGGPASPTFF